MAPRTGHFRYESGHHGELWLDPDRALRRPTAVRPFAVELATRLFRYQVDGVCGPLTGGAFVAQMVAEHLDVDFTFAERFAPPASDTLYAVRYRVPEALREGLRGRSLAIINDVTSAGSAVRGTYEDLLTCGARPVAIGTLLVLGSWSETFSAQHGLALEALAFRENPLWAPGECPLCASTVPLEDPAQ